MKRLAISIWILTAALSFVLVTFPLSRFRDPGPPWALQRAYDRTNAITIAPQDSCPWDMVPGDLERCYSLDISKVRIIPEPKFSTPLDRALLGPNVACRIEVGDARWGSVDWDGTVHWGWNDNLMNPHMRDKLKQACSAAVLEVKTSK